MESIHPDDRPRVREAALTKQIPGLYDETYRIILPDGSIRWIRDRAFPILNHEGRVYRIAGLAEDITERTGE
jgi:PAS domain S-box-containing protein